MTNIKKISDKNLELEFEITIPLDEFNQEINKELEKQQKTLKIDGFRKGKVPLNVIKNKYSALILSETAENLVEKTINQIIDENKYNLISRPQIEIKVLEMDKDFEFKATLNLFPEIPEIKYEKIKLKKQKAEVNDEEINKAKDRILKNFAKWVEQDKEYQAKNGDKVKIDFLGKLNGEPFEGGKGENYDLELGSKSFIDTFEDQLLGKKAGDEVEVKVTFPKNYHSKKLAGQPAVFEVKVHSVSTAEKQDITDEFVKENLGLESIEKLNEAITKELTSLYTKTTRNKLKEDIFEWLKKNVKVELPKNIVEEEFNRQWAQAERDMKNNPNKFKDDKEKDKKKKEVEQNAEESIKLGLILSEIGKKNNIQVQEAEVIEEIRQRASAMPGQEQMIVDFYLKNKPALNQITGSLLEDKVIDFIASKADTEEIILTPDELMKI